MKPEWTAEVASGYSGPSVADGRVYVSDRITKPAQTERIHCFDEKTGESLWSYAYECAYRNVSYTAGPRTSIQIRGGVAYSLGTMGNLVALDAKSGRLLWSRDLNKDYQIAMPMWGIAAAPLIMEDLIVVHIGGTPDATVVAVGLMDGKERWRALDDRASYSAPILIEQAGKQVIVVWTGDSVAGLDPLTGRVHWKQLFPPSRMVIGIATPIFRNNQLFVSSFYDGAMMVNLHPTELKASLAWASVGADEKNTAVRKARWSTAHFVRHQDNVWIFNEEGELLLTELSPEGMNVLSRAPLIAPTRDQLNQRGGVAWSHPAFANGHVFIRSDTQLLSVDLRQK